MTTQASGATGRITPLAFLADSAVATVCATCTPEAEQC
jgi:hypothetical protein